MQDPLRWGDKKTSDVDAEEKLNGIFGSKYRISLDHQILSDYGVFYPQALSNDLVFEPSLAPASQVVKGSEATKLKYKLTNIQLEYEMIRSNTLAEAAKSILSSDKAFAYDNVTRSKVVASKVNAQRRSLKAILLLFMEGYIGGGRDQRFRKIRLPGSEES